MKSKKILVTGGVGFIGTNLVNELRARGHEVLAIDLSNTERDQYIRSDVRNYRQLERIFEKQTFDYVYHLAGFYNSYGPREVPGKSRNVIPKLFYWAMKGQPLPIIG